MLYNRYKNSSFPDDNYLDLKLYYCGTEACEPGHSWGPGLKDHYKIHYIFSGKGTFEINNRTYHLEGGQGFLICPDTVAAYRADEKNPWTYAWAAFNGSRADWYLQQIGLSREQPVFSCDNETLIPQAFQNMFDVCKMHPSNDFHILSSLYYFLAMIKECSASGSASAKAGNMKDFYINRALEFIETNYSRNVNIREIAGYLSLSRNYMTKIFKENVGMSPQEYLIKYRMEKACLLMKNSYLSIGEISNSVGYSDPLLFSRMFKKTLGVSPRKYRDDVCLNE